MNVVRTEIYRGHNIRIVVLPPHGYEGSFRATYEIQRLLTAAHDGHKRGVVAGAMANAADAVEAALMAAKHTIDQNEDR